MKNTIKTLSIILFSIFLLSTASAMTVYSDFDDGTQAKSVSLGNGVSFNVDFFSMNPPMTAKVQIYKGSTLVHTFLSISTNAKTYYNTYSYTPSSSGTYEIRVTGTDTVNTDSEFLSLTVTSIPPINHAPVITSSPVLDVNEGSSYSYDVQATDADLDVLTYSLISAPGWLTINSNSGIITGTAPLVSFDTSYSVTVQVSDGIDSANQHYTLTVLNVPIPPSNHAPVITSSPVTSVTEGNVYNYNVDATDADLDVLTYSLISAPSWLTINSLTGLISGTAPLVSSNIYYTIQVQVSDGTDTDTQSYTLAVLNVVPGNHAPVITSSPVTSVVEGNTYSYNVDATDADGDSLTYSLLFAPGWLSINLNSGIISGTAPLVTSSTDYTVEVEVSDGTATDTQTYILKVKNFVSGGSGASGIRYLQDSDSYYQNKYFDQYNLDKTGTTSKTTSTTKNYGITAWVLFYILIGLISLGIIIIVFLLGKNLRR